MVNIRLKKVRLPLFFPPFPFFLSFPGANPSVEQLLREHSLLEDKPLFGLKTHWPMLAKITFTFVYVTAWGKKTTQVSKTL